MADDHVVFITALHAEAEDFLHGDCFAFHAGKGNYGFNAANDTYGDMIEMGILDPTKVTRTALQNAASVASLMLTTECMIAEAPKDEAAGGMGGMGGGDMGGMGGMGGMGM